MLNKLKPKSMFGRSILTLMTGTLAAQAIPILISPLLTRLYTPEDFGVLAIYLSIASLIAVVATARYELAVPLPRADINKLALMKLSFSIALIIAITSMAGISIVSLFNNTLTSSSKIGYWIYGVPFSVIFLSFYMPLNYWHTGAGNYKQISISRLWQAISTSITSIILGYLINGAVGLIIGTIFGQLIAVLVLGCKMERSNIETLLKVNKHKVWWIAKRYKQFPLYNTPHALFATGKNNFIILFLSTSYSPTALGLYYLTMRLMLLPAGLIGSAVAQVFYAEVSKKYKLTNNIRKNVMTMIVILFLVGLVPAIIIALFSEKIFTVIFGLNWSESGLYAAYITPYILFHFIASPIGMVPMVVGKQKTALFWGITESLLHMSVFIIGYYIFYDIGKTLLLLSIVLPLFFIIYFLWIVKISKGAKL